MSGPLRLTSLTEVSQALPVSWAGFECHLFTHWMTSHCVDGPRLVDSFTL